MYIFKYMTYIQVHFQLSTNATFAFFRRLLVQRQENPIPVRKSVAMK